MEKKGEPTTSKSVVSNKDDLIKLRKQLSVIKGSITKLYNNFSDIAFQLSLTKETLLIKEERLRSLFCKYEECNLAIMGMSDEAEDESVEEKYTQTLSIIMKLLNSISSSNNTNESKQPMPVKLPNINIPIYTGKYSDYRPFIELFKSLIDKNPNLDKLQRFYYLRGFLKGEPLELIKNLPMLAESYDESLEILDERYNNIYKIKSEHIYLLLDIPPIVKSTASNIRHFVSIVKQQLSALKNVNCNVEQWDTIILCVLMRKLDYICNREFQLTFNNDPTVKCLIQFLEKRALALENSERPNNENKGSLRAICGAATVKGGMSATAANNNTPSSCPLCKCSHKLYSCPKFKLMTIDDRLALVSNKKLCSICLNAHSKPCRYHFKCDTCKQKHNSLLHKDADPTPVTLLSNTTSTQVLLPTAKFKLVAADGTELHVKALLDSGAQVSLITSELVNILQLQPKEVESGVIGIGNFVNKLNKYVQFRIQSLINDFSLQISCFLLNKITCRLPQTKIDLSKLILPPGIALADKDFHVPSNIHILLGADIFFQVLLPNAPEATSPPSQQLSASVTKRDINRTALLNTQFGHVIAGNVAPSLQGPEQVVSLFCTKCDTELNETLTQFWQPESVPQVFKENISEHNTCENTFKENVQLKNNKFEVALPLKLPLNAVNETLGDSFYLALKRFYNLESRLQKDPNLLALYKNFINEYIRLGHASIIDINQYDLSKDPVYFLPHHPVVRMDKKTTKCRIVFDGSMKTNKKVALNDILLNGPSVQNELFNNLLLFRFEEFIFVTDIRHMFRAISLNSNYCSLQNILWRESPESEVKCIQLNTVTYGLKSSSYLATRCLIMLAEVYANKFPKAASILKNQTYVDDILATDSSLESLVESKEQLCQLLDLGGFQLHKWSSNRTEVLHDVPISKQYFDEIELQKDHAHLKTLGINFDIKSDNFTLHAPKNDGIPNTKREVLSFISKFYDPLGLAGPLTVKAKIIMQKLWLARMDWDSVLKDELQALWHEFYKGLTIMKPIHLKRYVNLPNAQCLQLIGFAYASSSAYGCCIYLRVIDANDQVKVSLICSKSRVNPHSQQLTVPRLELNAALLLAKLINILCTKPCL